MPSPYTQVLIVGAGPTGLALANLLAKHQVSFRIIDKNSNRSDKSKALGVQAGTLESIQYHLGHALVEKMISVGLKAPSVYFNFYDHSSVKVDLTLIPSLYNYILILAQSENERLLEENLHELGFHVERESELMSLNQHHEKVSVCIKKQAGDEQQLEVDFVIGCDGASSTVRKLVGLNFAGGEYTGNFILGDVQAKELAGKNSVEIYISNQGALAYFPINPKGLGRFVLIPQNLPSSESRDIGQTDFSALINELYPSSIQISAAPWLSRFTLHHRIVNHFRVARVFLAGDAAHIHSPLGGQGMNTGIQDAFNLGCKLVQVLAGKAPFSLLDRYEKQRHPIAEHILRATDLASRLLLLNNGCFARFIKRSILPRLLNIQWAQKRIVTAISEIKIARAEIRRAEAEKNSI